MIAARQIFLGRGGAKGWVNPYVTDGLVAMWDGEWNAGGGVHDDGAETWVDLRGSGANFVLYDVGVEGNCMTFTGDNSVYGELDAEQSAIFPTSGEATLEIVAMTTAPYGTGGVLLKTPSDCAIGMGMFSRMDFSNNVIGLATAVNGYARNVVEHWASVYSSNVASSAYNNGEIIVNTATDNIGGSQSVTTIGKRMTNISPFFGNIYSIRLYSRALTAAEIAANYAVDKARFNLP